MNTERKFVPGKNNVKDKQPISENVQKNEKGKEGAIAKDNQVKHIAQKNFNTNNRFAALASEGDEDTQNELLGIRVNIDVAVEMGVNIDKEIRDKWPKELQEYYEKRCSEVKKNASKLKLKEKIDSLEVEICKSNSGITANVHRIAEDMVAGEMESTGVSREQAFGVVYDIAYRDEIRRIHELVLIKQLAVVELFIESEQPFDNLVKEGWTDEMVVFYESRMLEKNGNGNKEGNEFRSVEAMVEEVGQDCTAHAGFITQNNVSSPADAAMAKDLGNVDAGPSSFIK